MLYLQLQVKNRLFGIDLVTGLLKVIIHLVTYQSGFLFVVLISVLTLLFVTYIAVHTKPCTALHS